MQLAEGATLTLGGGVRLVQGLGWLISLAFTSPGTVVVGAGGEEDSVTLLGGGDQPEALATAQG